MPTHQGIKGMGWDFIICISSLIGATALGLRLAAYNLKHRQETHELRMQIYRQRKKLKNEKLRRQLGLARPEHLQNLPEADCKSPSPSL